MVLLVGNLLLLEGRKGRRADDPPNCHGIVEVPTLVTTVYNVEVGKVIKYLNTSASLFLLSAVNHARPRQA